MGAFSPINDPGSPCCLLLFDSNTHLMGYAAGMLEAAGNAAAAAHPLRL